MEHLDWNYALVCCEMEIGTLEILQEFTSNPVPIILRQVLLEDCISHYKKGMRTKELYKAMTGNIEKVGGEDIYTI